MRPRVENKFEQILKGQEKIQVFRKAIRTNGSGYKFL